jgi:hypothetical protein
VSVCAARAVVPGPFSAAIRSVGLGARPARCAVAGGGDGALPQVARRRRLGASPKDHAPRELIEQGDIYDRGNFGGTHHSWDVFVGQVGRGNVRAVVLNGRDIAQRGVAHPAYPQGGTRTVRHRVDQWDGWPTPARPACPPPSRGDELVMRGF